MNLKRLWASLLTILLIFSSISFTTAKAADIQMDDEITVEPSEDNPLVLLDNPSKDSKNAKVLTESSTLSVSEVGAKYKEVTYTDDVSGEKISGYVSAEELNKYLIETTAKKVVVAPSEQEPLELLIDGKLRDETVVYLTEETTLISLGAEGHFTKVKYTLPNTSETVEALVLSDGLNAAVIEEENVQYVVIPEGESLSFLDEPSLEGNLVFDLLVDSYLTIGDEDQYIKVAYKDIETGNEVEGYILYSDLINFTDDIKEQAKNFSFAARSITQIKPTPVILDISHWQLPQAINYPELAKEIDLAIIRVQYGMTTEDKYYKTHIQEFQKENVPVHVYAFLTAKTEEEAKEEARLFYNRAKQFDPIMYWVDVEVDSADETTNMRNITSAYVSELRKLVGDAKVGGYIANHLYAAFNINVDELDAVWIPTYGPNNGYYNPAYVDQNGRVNANDPWYPSDLHQYTDQGTLNGYQGGLNGSAATLDLSRLTDPTVKDLAYFTSKKSSNTDNSNNSSNNSNINSSSYYTTNPGTIRLTSTENIYKSVEFSDSTKTGKTLSVGSIVTVTGIEYSKAGTPRLRVSGGYITANKKYSTTDTTTFYSSNPGKVRLTSTENIYKTVEFNDSTKTGQTLPVGSIAAVTGIEYSKAGTPRLKVSGGYITANKKYSTTDTTTYYSSNPKKVRLTSAESIYKTVEFNDSTKTGQTLPVGSIVTVTGIEYSKAGTPRLKVSGGYITANKKYSTTDTTTYYSSNPGTIHLTAKLNVYSAPEFTESTKTGKSYAKGTTVKVTGIAYSRAGTPRLKVSGGYISANKSYSKQ